MVPDAAAVGLGNPFAARRERGTEAAPPAVPAPGGGRGGWGVRQHQFVADLGLGLGSAGSAHTPADALAAGQSWQQPAAAQASRGGGGGASEHGAGKLSGGLPSLLEASSPPPRTPQARPLAL